MERLINILVFGFLFLHCTNSQELVKEQTTYAYKGKILMKNAASDQLASIWTVSAKLLVEDLTDHITFKLDDVKTRIYNGDPNSLNTVQEKNIPEDSKIIQEPFFVYPGDKSGYNISHKPNEPIWSLNMKRSIANIFFLNTDRKTNSVVNETTIYGHCEVRYKISKNEETTIWKIIDRKNCENSTKYDLSNVQWDPTAKDFEPIKSETKRIYHFDGSENLKKVESISFTTYQSMPGVRSKQIIEQSQEFNQISKTTTFEPLSTAELSETSSIIFDYSKETDENSRNVIEKKSPNELLAYFNANYDEFKEYFEKSPLFNVGLDVNDTISYMYEALEQMDKETLLRLEKKIMKRDDNLLKHLFVSYLPYLGTNESLHYIKDLVAQDEVMNDLLTIKILATLPAYINDISEEIVEEMEGLMNLKKVANNQVKYAGILSFASIVSAANAKDVLSMKRLTKYVSIYSKKYDDADSHEIKMVWLLGLINMANSLKNEDILSLITNSDESRHIRVLAAYGFKEHLTVEASSEMYENMWPIVKNISEPFEVRVACLDLLLYSQITEEQFKNIVNWYKDELVEPSEQHLANYMYTSLIALQNTTGYYEYLGDYATEALEEIKPLKMHKAWSTGNYRMAYTDSDGNFGMSFQAKLISHPVTNVLNSAFFTVDSFAHSLNFGRYSAYIKAEGLADMLFSFFMINTSEEATVPKLLELIRQNAYKFKENDENVHIDIVIFCKDRVVFSMHINKNNVDNYSENPLFLELFSLIIDYNSLSFPVFDYTYEVSDLGTSVMISTDIVEAASYELRGLNQIFDGSSSSSEEDDLAECTSNYRSMWYYSLYTECYNPLIDTSIATYKYISEEKSIHIPYAFNFTSMLLQWKHEKDAFNIIGDHLIGTTVDKENVLHEYCENCQQVRLINTDNWKSDIVNNKLFGQVTGVAFNLTYTEPSTEQLELDSIEPIRTGSLFDIMDQHQSITFDNMAQPFLLFSHYMTYSRYINNDLYRYSIRSLPIYNDEPSETILELSYESDDNSSDENPIAKSDLNVSLALSTRKQHDAEILSHANLTFRYFSASESNSSEVQPHIHHKYNVHLFMYSDTVKSAKVCIDRDVQYPSRRTNKFSLDPVDIAVAVTTFSLGENDNTTASECPTIHKFYMKEVYSASDNQKARMLASNEYKNCKEQSKGLKYTPPTDDCLAAHEMISKYQNCDIYGDEIPPTKNSPGVRTEHGIHLINYSQFNESYAKMTLIDEDLPEKIMNKPYALRKAIESEDYLPLMTFNPRVAAYDDDYIEWGVERACYITPSRIRTFTGHTIKKYYEKSGVDSVAFVECSNATAKGMTIQKYGDKHVGFQFYKYEDILTGSVEDGKLKIKFNNETITKTNNIIESEAFKVYFLDDDVIFISSGIIDILYTGEYISLEVYSIYNNYICGLCSETQHY